MPPVGKLVAACALVGCGLAAVAWRNRVGAPYAPVKITLEAVRALATDGFEVDRFEVERGVHLVGLVRRPHDAGAPWVLYFAGNGAAQLRGGRDLLQRLAPDGSFGVATWANRGFDASEGRPAPEALHGDARALYARLRRAFGASTVHLVGFSMGAEIATSLGANLCREGVDPATVTLISSYTGPYLMLQDAWYGRLDPFPDRYAPDQVVDAITAPVLVVHARGDDAHPVGQARALAERLGRRARLTEIDGGHAAPLSDPSAIAAIRRAIGSGALL